MEEGRDRFIEGFCLTILISMVGLTAYILILY